MNGLTVNNTEYPGYDIDNGPMVTAEEGISLQSVPNGKFKDKHIKIRKSVCLDTHVNDLLKLFL